MSSTNDMRRSASEYVDNLKEPYRSDPKLRGVIEQAFMAGRSNPAHELADIQAKPTEREPLLSDSYRDSAVPFKRQETAAAFVRGADFARYFYESKITSGELRVVKKVATITIGWRAFCDYCGTCVDPCPDFANRPANPLCPGCGAQIVKG